MTIDSKTGLVLEGGGMRGVFTCGVLDYMLDKKIYFNYAVGVSAGACNGLSYMSRQRGRAKFSNIDLYAKYRYIGLKYLWKQHSIFDLELLYERFPQEIIPYDYYAFFRNEAEFEMVTMNCNTGQTCYLSEDNNADRLLQIVKASSALPFACPMVEIDGVPMLDGGIGDSIPLVRSIEKGHEKNVVVLTRNRGYRKHTKDIHVPFFVYRKYPRLREAISHRCYLYNRQLQMVEDMEDEGRIIVIRPQKPVEVNRIEKDVKKLQRLYDEGYSEAEVVLSKLDISLGR